MNPALRSNIILVALILVFAPQAFSKAIPKAVITGDEIELIKGGKTVIFTGNAKVIRGSSEIWADKIVQDKTTNLAEASGNIYFKSYSKDHELVEARAGKANFYLSTGLGEMWEGRPEIKYYVKGSTAAMALSADRLEFNQNEESIFASGDVEIISSSITARSPKAFFGKGDKKVILQSNGKRPKISYLEKNKFSEYEADTIVMYMDRKSADLTGNVKGKLYDAAVNKP